MTKSSIGRAREAHPPSSKLLGIVVVLLGSGIAVGAIESARAQVPPYPPSPVIEEITFDWSTHRRAAQGSDNFQLTWSDDGHQYGWWGDGGGFGGTNSDGRVSLGFARIEGDWDDWKGFNVWGGKNPENNATFNGKRDRLFEGREHYEWFTGMSDVAPTWGDLDAKQPVLEDANGTGWCLSASHNPGLGRYLLTTEHTRSHVDNLLGIFDAPEPWGPWTTVKYWAPDDRFGETRPGSDLAWEFNVFFLAFSPKWLSDDGRAFTLNFTGSGRGKDNDSFNTVRGRFVLRQGE